MEGGFIKIHRKILDWEWFTDENTLKVFLYLLLKANWEDSKYKGYMIPRGSCVIGRKDMAQKLKMSERSVRTSLDHLKSTNEITIKSTNKFSIANIVKYNDYQCIEKENRPANRPTTDQQIDQQIDQQPTNKSTNKKTSEKPIQSTFQTIENSESTNKNSENQPTNRPANRPHLKNIKNIRNKNNNIPPLSPQGETVEIQPNNILLIPESFKEETDSAVEIPEKLNTVKFLSTWHDWERYRKEKRQTLKPSTVKKQLEFLAAFDVDTAIKIIEQSIMQGWTGLFELKTNKSSPQQQNNNQNSGLISDSRKKIIEEFLNGD